MYLSKEEEKILSGEAGEVFQKAMEILVALGEIYQADKLIPIKSTQISGVSYKTISDAGLEFLEEFAQKNAQAKVYSTLNPAGMDLARWTELKIPKSFAEKQLRIIRAYEKIGIKPTCTCTPYLVENIPELNDHIAWAESSAVVFANSVLGARTNREGGPSALAAAMIGKTPNYGYHLAENRQGTILVEMKETIDPEQSIVGAIGYFVGEMCMDRVPVFTGMKYLTWDHHKALGAALAAGGAIALYHVLGETPEAKLEKKIFKEKQIERITVSKAEIDKTYEKLTSSRPKNIDLVAIGCPHCSAKELSAVANELRGKRVKTQLWVCTSRAIK
ncbi:MAG: aconitase X catalytic domain-containing protein, partial [Euryarchaeota archaeon]|nr:aconitase X catalytic domain-containing protein [Euryarchaeota archaeon]